MLALGADVNFYDYIHVGNSPLHRAALQGRRDVVEVRLCLIFLKKKISPLCCLNPSALLPKPRCKSAAACSSAHMLTKPLCAAN